MSAVATIVKPTAINNAPVPNAHSNVGPLEYVPLDITLETSTMVADIIKTDIAPRAKTPNPNPNVAETNNPNKTMLTPKANKDNPTPSAHSKFG